jgi:hypothetical protein
MVISSDSLQWIRKTLPGHTVLPVLKKTYPETGVIDEGKSCTEEFCVFRNRFESGSNYDRLDVDGFGWAVVGSYDRDLFAGIVLWLVLVVKIVICLGIHSV